MRFFLILLFISIYGIQLSSCALDQTSKDIQAQQYIETYKKMAIDEMFKMGVPASIKLAQGMLETDFGTSRLSKLGKNHFGIKCKDYWIGDTILVDDDTPQECFRRYTNARDSYIDHSMFLRYHPKKNYLHLFDLSPRDYFSWAYGLKESGYATNARYAETLIELIERYQLYTFDDYVLAQQKNDKIPSDKTTPYKIPTIYANAALAYNNNPQTTYTTKPQTNPSTPQNYSNQTIPTSHTPKNINKAAILPDQITHVFKPQDKKNNTPKNINNPNPTEKKNDAEQYEVKKFIAYTQTESSNTTTNPDEQPNEKNDATNTEKLTIQNLNVNGIPAMIANKNLSVFYVAYLNEISEKKIYKYNEIKLGEKFKAGIPIFLAPKQNKTDLQVASTYTSSISESLHQIAQRFGIKTKQLKRLNPQLAQSWVKSGETINLR